MNDPVYVNVSLVSINEPAHQLRERIAPEALGALADSMAAEGLHQPIGVREAAARGLYEIVWGHRRYLAARLLRWPTISARIFPSDYDPLLAAVSENLNREQLNPMEEAHAVKQFLDRGAPRAEIARLFRRSPHWIDSRAALLDLPEDLQQTIRDGALPLAVASLLADVDYVPYREELIGEAVKNGASAATVAVWRQHYLADRARIASNTLAIEAVIQERNKYVVHYPCDWCDQEVEYQHTRTVRLCVACMEQLIEAKTAGTR